MDKEDWRDDVGDDGDWSGAASFCWWIAVWEMEV